MRLNKLLFLFVWLYSFSSFGQFGEPEISLTKEEKFLYPVNPGQPGSLAGNMGELRTTHFHSGLDVRTDNRIGYAVRASKSGYISRVAMSPSGYGNVLYVTHPDGHTTLYAHLDHFSGPLAGYVLQEQYKRKTFEIDLTLNENDFVVRQGDVIAISGNSGSSGGPHLHFEVRDAGNHALNPLKAGFKEITDRTPPVVEKVALVTLDANARINDRFGRFEFYAYRRGNSYTISSPILASGHIGIEVLAKDKFVPRGQFYGGVNYINMRVDDELVFDQAIERINLEETRGIYTLMNFKTLRTTGARFYKLYIDDGNFLPFYNASPASGKLYVGPGKDSDVEVRLHDPFNNESKLSFRLRPSPRIREVKTLEAAGTEPRYDIYDNTMMVTVRPCPGEDSKTIVYAKGEAVTVYPDYYNTRSEVYLIDLRKHLPDSVVLCDKTLVTNLMTTIPSSTEYKYYSDWINIQFPVDALYDTLFLNASVQNDEYEVYTIGDRTTPLNRNITIEINPQREYIKDKTLGVYRMVGRSSVYLGGTWNNGRLTFQTRELGDFTILYDTVPPSVRALSLNNRMVRFRISDDLSGIASYDAYIDGQWLLMHYDRKTATIRSERLDKTAPIQGAFELRVTDYAGNEQIFTHTIP